MGTRQGGKEQGDVKSRSRVKKPRKWKVIIHNDDYTTMEFVVLVLKQVFRHTSASATRIMLHVHQSGIGVAGVYTKEIAEMRIDQVLDMSRSAGHPLQCSMEPE